MNNMNNINNTTASYLMKRTEVIKNLFNKFYYAMTAVQKENLSIRLGAVQEDICEELKYADKEETCDLNKISEILDKYDSLMKSYKS